jgi:POT family proton-dependent oligopeptide transporter
VSAPLSRDDRPWFGHPRGLSTLYFTELWERFSYYGMRALLLLYMVRPVSEGALGWDDQRATLIYGTYTMSVYLLAILGGYLGDRFLGARRAVSSAAVLITAGHFTLAIPSQGAFFAGLVLVALGSGLLKPNMSTLVGGLYAPDDPRRDAGFSIFYMGINVGAWAGPLVAGFLAQNEAWKALLASYGFDPAASWHWGFGSAGVGMALGLFWMRTTQHRIAHVGNPPDASAPRPWRGLAGVAAATAAAFAFIELTDRPGWQWLRWSFVALPAAFTLALGLRRNEASRRLAVVGVFFLAALLFWAVFEQGGSTLALFGDRLTRNELFGWTFPSAWYQSVGPVFVFTLAPAFAWLWLRLGPRQPSSAAKLALGLALLGISFALMVPAARLTAQGLVSPWWLVALFFVQTLGELCLSPIGLSTLTRLAPAAWVGVVMGIWFLASALGSKLAGVMAGEFAATEPAQLARFFEAQALGVALAAATLFAFVPLLKRWMGEAR